jgi:hypothetical protein
VSASSHFDIKPLLTVQIASEHDTQESASSTRTTAIGIRLHVHVSEWRARKKGKEEGRRRKEGRGVSVKAAGVCVPSNFIQEPKKNVVCDRVCGWCDAGMMCSANIPAT